MARFLGRNAVILVGASSPPATPVEEHMDANIDMGEVTTDATSNDSGGSEEHDIVMDNGSLNFKVFTDEAAAGQNVLRDAYENKTKVYVEARPRGTGSGNRYYRCQATVSLKRATPLRQLARTDVTLKKSGPWTIANQA